MSSGNGSHWARTPSTPATFWRALSGSCMELEPEVGIQTSVHMQRQDRHAGWHRRMPHLAAGVFVHPFTHIVDIVVNDEKLLAPRDLRLNLGVQTGG